MATDPELHPIVARHAIAGLARLLAMIPPGEDIPLSAIEPLVRLLADAIAADRAEEALASP